MSSQPRKPAQAFQGKHELRVVKILPVGQCKLLWQCPLQVGLTSSATPQFELPIIKRIKTLRNGNYVRNFCAGHVIDAAKSLNSFLLPHSPIIVKNSRNAACPTQRYMPQSCPRERDKEGPRFISLSRIIPSQILMGLAHLGRSLRWAARKYGCRRLKCLNQNNQERRGASERAAHYTTMFVRPPSRFLRYRSVRVAPAGRPRKMTWSTWMDLS